ncbi:hypothetical protein HMPREF9141_1938 [Prevotella multiformis DSM 16608]|uniref:Uncharacterized protein n=1 Tax=Prevotella multiformis DSM 16608 TaxID=888743 RepID=F0F8M1_9BACT|nr:hypothetical protein HMPREF9141_1938 [Prevotella multiformis DSM 16608]
MPLERKHFLTCLQFILFFMFAALRLGGISDIFKCFENFVYQALGFLAGIYAVEAIYRVSLSLFYLKSIIFAITKRQNV